MKHKPGKPPVPAVREETLRQSIAAFLAKAEGAFSARDISAEIGMAEKDVYFHLVHVQRSQSRGENGPALVVVPATCKKCGFTFKKRERLTKPGKCPICNGESIEPPLFSMK